ncbi:nitroreductase [Methanobrevibacter sp. 87.7]|uniref:nitroreductase family protein n=1 Tax=Methanobrevibacter sp. 87.7 TaxID=387957 RepID=UPI000B507EC2|nr:nitroreductase family protein [Methanobrevibacter sp. 87.7]OWT32409.1 nitroreductase [Methanobrevibacter sp. 87.7]
MDFFEVIEKRYSVRGYKDEPVKKEDLDKILKAAALAPTAKNVQPIKVFVIDTNKNKEALKAIYPASWFYNAPLVLCVAVDYDSAGKRSGDNRNFADIDGSIVMDNIILAATALNLGTCYIGAFNPDAAKDFINSDNYTPLLFTPLGYIDADPRVQDKKSVDEIVEYL